ncbi:hypothetical protein BLSTO_05657 [Blastocystis sp. subtype 1]
MESAPTAPATSSGRLLKTDSEKSRSLDEDRAQFVEEEYDFLSHELSGWLSSLIGREIGDNIVDALEDGTVLCTIVKKCLPDVKMEPFHENAEKGSFFAKDNIAVFARACQNMGIDKNECLTVSMLERKDRKLVVNAILRFALVGIKFGLKPIGLIHSDRLKAFVEAMPEELSANIKELAEKKEEAKGDEVETTEEPPHKSSASSSSCTRSWPSCSTSPSR